MTTEIVGYFIWCRGAKGVPEPMKQDAEIREGAQPERIKERAEMEIGTPQPLGPEGWAMSLDELAVLYPAPKKTTTEKGT